MVETDWKELHVIGHETDNMSIKSKEQYQSIKSKEQYQRSEEHAPIFVVNECQVDSLACQYELYLGGTAS